MASLETQHPLLMVPHVVSFTVVFYTNGRAPTFPIEAVRDALIAIVPDGTGVGSVSCVVHGVYDGKQS